MSFQTFSSINYDPMLLSWTALRTLSTLVHDITFFQVRYVI